MTTSHLSDEQFRVLETKLKQYRYRINMGLLVREFGVTYADLSNIKFGRFSRCKHYGDDKYNSKIPRDNLY